jgi:hypothetical protein
MRSRGRRLACGYHPRGARLRGGPFEHLLPQVSGRRGQRKQPGECLRTQRAWLAGPAAVALSDMLADQLEYSGGQLFIVAGQQLGKFRAGPPSGARDAQRAEGFLQLPAAVTDQGIRPLRRYAEHGRHVGVIEVVPQAQLDRLALIGRQRGQRGADQPPQFGRLPRGRGTVHICAVHIGAGAGTGACGTGTRPPQALAAGRAEQPQAHLGRVAQAVA